MSNDKNPLTSIMEKYEMELLKIAIPEALIVDYDNDKYIIIFSWNNLLFEFDYKSYRVYELPIDGMMIDNHAYAAEIFENLIYSLHKKKQLENLLPPQLDEYKDDNNNFD